MNTSTKTWIPVSEAVARLVNFHGLPIGHSLLDMTVAFLEEAKDEEAKAETELERDQARLRAEVCQYRHHTAEALFKAVANACQQHPAPFAVMDSGVEPSVDWAGFQAWARDRFGITVANPEAVVVGRPVCVHDPVEEDVASGKAQQNFLLLFYVLLRQHCKINRKLMTDERTFVINSVALNLEKYAAAHLADDTKSGVRVNHRRLKVSYDDGRVHQSVSGLGSSSIGGKIKQAEAAWRELLENA